MVTASIAEHITFDIPKPKVELLLESEFTKELRITFKEGQLMKEHKTPYPIVIHVVEGAIDFGVNGDVSRLSKGQLLTLQGGVSHDLKAVKNSVVRLTLSTADELKRVEHVTGLTQN